MIAIDCGNIKAAIESFHKANRTSYDRMVVVADNDANLAGEKGAQAAVDAFGVHGVGGMWGAIATGLWATTSVNPDGANGLFYGETDLFFAQIISIGVAVIFAVVGSTLLYKVVSAIVSLRADESEEISGLDLVEHGERGYNTGVFSGTSNIFGGSEDFSLKIFPSIKSSQG